MTDFIKISKYAGMREDLVQAGGGNSSYKESDKKMYIKASGFQLSDISDKDGYAIVNPNVIKDVFLNTENLDVITESKGKVVLDSAYISGCRPSIETFLHSVSGKYTLHTHPIVVNALTCRENWDDILRELFPKALLVPYATPGVELAKVYFKEYRNCDSELKGNIVFLQNHGLVVSGDNADCVISYTEFITRTIEDYLKTEKMKTYHVLTRLWDYFPEKILWKVTDENVMRMYRNRGLWKHKFCPDCIVFLGKRMLSLGTDISNDDVKDFIENYGYPVIIENMGNLYICADSVKKALEVQSVLSFSAQVMEMNTGCECKMLTEAEQNFLISWDAEKYRKSLNK